MASYLRVSETRFKGCAHRIGFVRGTLGAHHDGLSAALISDAMVDTA